MKRKINYIALLPYFICITAYSFTAILNMEVIEQLLTLNGALNHSLDEIYHYDIFGYFVGALVLLISSNYFTLQKIGIFTLLIYIISVFNTAFLEPSHGSLEFYSLIYSATNIIINTILLCYLLKEKKIFKTDILNIFSLSICTAYFLVKYFLFYKNSTVEVINISFIRHLVIWNIIPIIIFLFIFYNNLNSTLKNDSTKILIILKNIELELLSAFTISYIIITISAGYEVYVLTDSLLMISISELKYYIFIAMLLTIVFISRFIFNFNAYKINIIYILTLLCIFLSMPFWGISLSLSSICWFIVGIILYMFFWSNIFILIERFETLNLCLAIILYMLAASIGYYCGYISTNIYVNIIRENDFLISVCFALFILLAYYLYIYKKKNLKNW